MSQKTIEQLAAQADVQPTDLLVIQRGSNPLARILASTLATYIAGLVTGVLKAANNLNDLASVAQARSNLGLGALSTASTVPAALGYTPANKSGDTFSGAVTAPSFIGPLTGNCSGSSSSCTGNAATATNASAATNGQSGFAIAGLTGARVAVGSASNSGRISWGTAAPGALAVGEIYLQVPAA